MNLPIKLTVITAAFLVLVNIVVLAGVAYNRSGEAEATATLTERELRLPYYSYNRKENSGLSLRLNWSVITSNLFSNGYRKYSLSNYGNPVWLNENKLKELGADIEKIKANKKSNSYDYRNEDSIEAIIVLEYDGPAFKNTVKRAEKDIQNLREEFKKRQDNEDAKKVLKRHEDSFQELKTSESRLIAIDAGQDLEKLQTKYNKPGKYLMLRGEVKPNWSDYDLEGRIKKIFNSNVHMPLPYSKEISELTKSKKTSSRYNRRKEKPRYQVELKVGKRLEFWVGGVGGI